jgi:uncharacterized protein (TIGR02217 family)
MTTPTIIDDLAPTFPECPGFGFTVEPRYMVKAIEREGGYERVDRRWQYPLTFITASPTGNRAADVIGNVLAFWHAMGGQSLGFRFRDYSDYKSCQVQDTPSSSAPEQPFIVAVGVSPTAYQLVKEYTAITEGSPGTYFNQIRPIYRPIGSTINVWNTSSVLQTDWTLDEATGIVTPGGSFTGTPGGWSGEFDLWMRFASDIQITITDGEESERIMSAVFTLREKRPND